MTIYAVTFRADVYNRKDLLAEHEIILSAETPEDAESKAIEFFKRGDGRGWTKLPEWIKEVEPIIRNIKTKALRRIIAKERKIIVADYES